MTLYKIALREISFFFFSFLHFFHFLVSLPFSLSLLNCYSRIHKPLRRDFPEDYTQGNIRTVIFFFLVSSPFCSCLLICYSPIRKPFTCDSFKISLQRAHGHLIFLSIPSSFRVLDLSLCPSLLFRSTRIDKPLTGDSM